MTHSTSGLFPSTRRLNFERRRSQQNQLLVIIHFEGVIGYVQTVDRCRYKRE